MVSREVTVFRPNPAAWTRALELARGDATRIEIVDETTLIVRNAPREGRRRPLTTERGAGSH